MAIQAPLQTKTYDLREEIASRALLLTRTVAPDCSVSFGAVIHPLAITYELDAQGNKIAIYEEKQLMEFAVSYEKLMQLFSIQVTLVDGTVSYIGEVLSNFADQLILEDLVKNIPLEQREAAKQQLTVTTQSINMTPVAQP